MNCKCLIYKAFRSLAEEVRFELTDLLQSPVFKTGAFNRSATLPQRFKSTIIENF